MRILVGRLAIILLVVGGLSLSYTIFQLNSPKAAAILFFWIIVFIPLGFWTRTNPKKAFLIAVIYYLSSVIIKDTLWGGEYILPFLIHIYFITSMLIGMGVFSNSSEKS